MSKPIGPREQALRDARAQDHANIKNPARETLAAALPATSGKKPVKRKAKRRAK